MFLMRSGAPAWERLVCRPLPKNECISLITDLFSDRDEVEAIKRLSRANAQSFVDVLDEVFPRSYPRR